ncbi:DUF4142 domain-containing protein [Roseicella aerolata]|uniref:DUF4142 domain-containing protein n=1 Tax=Roseicella aerolata TaxID=2883479 RepID=A0A9X1IJ27_9PROT|nr:DUF4142 domain-containing protein [Roseicella aerolata]MCB4825061.1 DUF4142 domain-containing protein [Roseicella aerolata]
MNGTAGHRGSEVLNRQEFVRFAYSNALFEMETARLALERSRDEKQRRFAQEMLDAHGQSAEELRGLLRNQADLRSIQPPEKMADQHQPWLGQPRTAQGENFQTLYAQQQAQAHLIALDLCRNYAQAADDETLKRWAAARLPVLQAHLREAQALKGGSP